MSADLHIHTNFSDGTETPEKVVELAKKAGLKTIAITDHDVVDGIEPAIKKGKEIGVEVIPGIEFTTEAHHTEIHILGYFIDYRHPELINTLAKIQKGREERIIKICEKLKKLGVDLDPEKVFEIAGHRAAGRPHVARALIQEGYVGSFKEAFYRYIDFRGPAYVSHYKLSPREAIKLILLCKGIPILAHPGLANCDEIIPELIVEGLRGLEIYYSTHSPEQIKNYLYMAKKEGLLVTGGSDFHGTHGGREALLGEVALSDERVEELKNEHLC